MFLTKGISKRESRKLQVVKHSHCSLHTEGGRENTTQSMKLIINEHYCFHMNSVEITGLVFKEKEGG